MFICRADASRRRTPWSGSAKTGRRGVGRDPGRSPHNVATLVPCLLVHNIPQRLAFDKAPGVFQENVHRQFEPSGYMVGAVWRQEQVLHFVERMTGGKRLL